MTMRWWSRPAVYLCDAPGSTLMLWCYLIWYLGIVARHFDPSPMLWVNSVGMSVVVGTALYAGIGRGGQTPSRSVALSRWQVFRLYFTPFCVSSYVALTNGLGFVLVFPSDVTEALQVLAPCLVLLVAAVIARRRRRSELSYEL